MNTYFKLIKSEGCLTDSGIREVPDAEIILKIDDSEIKLNCTKLRLNTNKEIINTDISLSECITVALDKIKEINSKQAECNIISEYTHIETEYTADVLNSLYTILLHYSKSVGNMIMFMYLQKEDYEYLKENTDKLTASGFKLIEEYKAVMMYL